MQSNVDGVFFGTTFPHLLLMTYPSLRPPRPTEAYVPRVFGFKLHESALARPPPDPAAQRQNGARAPPWPAASATWCCRPWLQGAFYKGLVAAPIALGAEPTWIGTGCRAHLPGTAGASWRGRDAGLL